MKPTLESGDLILINSRDRELRDGIFAFNEQPNQLLIRRVTAVGAGKYQLLCDNEAYRVAAQPAGEINWPVLVFGRLIWTAGLI